MFVRELSVRIYCVTHTYKPRFPASPTPLSDNTTMTESAPVVKSRYVYINHGILKYKLSSRDFVIYSERISTVSVCDRIVLVG